MVFSGIVERVGRVVSLTKDDQMEKAGDGSVVHHLWIDTDGVDGEMAAQEGQYFLQDVRLGDSISVNGTCLTVTCMREKRHFSVDLAPETLRKTNLGDLEKGHHVNLEKAMAVGSRFGGHIVQGHVDDTGIIQEKRLDGGSLWLTIAVPRSLARYIVPKGYVTLDGTSLTVCEVTVPDLIKDQTDQPRATFTIMLVPYTQDHVILPSKRVGDRVNIEVDVLGKYVENLIKFRE